jgi:hypothetical protein
MDHFHTIRLANRVVDQVRRRTNNVTLGHRGRRHEPLYRIRRIALVGSERRPWTGRTEGELRTSSERHLI